MRNKINKFQMLMQKYDEKTQEKFKQIKNFV